MQKIRTFVYKLLRRSETMTQSDMVSLAKESTWMTISKIIVSGTALLLTIVLANALPQAVYGQYKFVISLFGIVIAFSLTGMSTAIIQAVSRGFDRFFFVAVRTHLRWGLIMSVIALGMSAYYFIKSNEQLGTSLLFIAVAAPLMQAFALYSPYLQGKRRFKDEAKYSFFYHIIPALLLIITALTTDSFITMIAVYFGSYTLVTLFIFLRVRKSIPETQAIDPQSNTYGKHLSFMNVLATLSSQIDKVLVFHHLGAIQLATYTIALAAPQQLRHVNKLVSTISLTRLSNVPIETIKKVLPRKLLLLLILGIGITLVYILLAQPFYNLFFPTYDNAAYYSQIYALIILFLPVVLFQQTLTAHMKKRELYILQTVIPIIKIVSLIILLPLYGVLGALGAIFIAEILRALLITYFYIKL